MKLAILTCDEDSVCDQQDKICDGINCKTCQFNKYGIDIEYFRKQLYTIIRNYLDDNREKDYLSKADDLSHIIIKELIQEESNERIIGEKVFKKKLH